jgi:hypothetical protein
MTSLQSALERDELRLNQSRHSAWTQIPVIASEAKQSSSIAIRFYSGILDCFVATLLAMTAVALDFINRILSQALRMTPAPI